MAVIGTFTTLAVQLFVVVLEFKLTTLAGFILAPFGLFGRTSFLAERVLGNVMATGVKVLVLAVIVGIGSTLFQGFVSDFAGDQPTLDEILAVALGALALLGLGIFGPGVAAGLVSGAPHLGAGAAVGTGMAVAGAAMAGAAGLRSAAGAAAAVVKGASSPGPGGAAAASGPRPGDPPGGEGPGPPPSGGPAGGGGGAESGAGGRPAPGASEAPAWARKLRRSQSIASGVTAAANAIRAGDHAAGSAAVPLNEERS